MTEQGGNLERGQFAHNALNDQVLLHTRTVRAAAPDQEAVNGMILCGPQALREAKNALFHLSGAPLLLDPARYEHHTASIHTAFHRPRQSDDCPLLSPEISGNSPGYEQLNAGATAVLTPTYFFTAGDPASVQAATRDMQSQDAATVIFVVPLDAQWLQTDENIRFLIRTLNEVPHTKALALGSIDNPLPDQRTARRLRALITGINRAALIRTGLAGLDAYAHGATFVAIGAQNACRAFRPPNAQGRRDANPSGGPQPYVLHPVLMEYFHGAELAYLYGRGNAPECACSACNGQHLARFSNDPDDVEAANQHNLAVWLPWAEELQLAPSGRARRRLWQQRCWEAIDARAGVECQWRSRRSPQLPADLSFWATQED